MLFKANRPVLPLIPILLVFASLTFLRGHLHSTIHRNDLHKDFSASSSSDSMISSSSNVTSQLSTGSRSGDDRRNEASPQVISNTNRYCDTHSNTNKGPCIFDIGFNTGQDTIQYLKVSPTSRVLAIEANPTLVDAGKETFKDAIGAGRLKLINIGLVGNETENKETSPKLAFWINTHKDVFSSFRQKTGCRDPRGVFLPEGNTTYCRKIEMDTMSCSELVKEYGTPHYMKVDIEGLDRACVNSLGNIKEKDRPKYISKENVWSHDIESLATLGYKRFKVVNQNQLQKAVVGTELIGHSGPWGEDAEDLWIGKKWHSLEQVLGRLPLPDFIKVNGKKVKGWYDLHAKK